MRRFAYDAGSVVLGVIALFALAAWAGMRSDPRTGPIALAILGGIGLAAVAGVVVVRASRRRWLEQIAIYDSYGAFAALAKERKGVVHDFGRKALGKPLAIARAVGVPSVSEVEIHDTYHAFRARRGVDLAEPDYRRAIDALLVEASRRDRL